MATSIDSSESPTNIRKMDVAEMAPWLQEKGIPNKFTEKFEGVYIYVCMCVRCFFLVFFVLTFNFSSVENYIDG